MKEEEGQDLKKVESEKDAEGPESPWPGAVVPEKVSASFDVSFLQEFVCVSAAEK